MSFLAFDTSTPLGSVAVGDPKGGVVARRFLRERGVHASLLLPAVRSVLEEAGRTLEELEGVIVGAGPGSFTGLRVAAATAKGLAHASGVSLFGPSSLASAAVTLGLDVPGMQGTQPDMAPPVERRPILSPGAGERTRVVLFDARGTRVYAAAYRLVGPGLRTVLPPSPGVVGDVETWNLPPDSIFCGPGAQRHREWLLDRGFGVIEPPEGEPVRGLPTADGLIALLGLREARPIDDTFHWEPHYLREWKPDRVRSSG